MRKCTAVMATFSSLLLQSTATSGTPVRVGVRRTAAGLAELDRLFWAISEPGNPLYQRYLTPAQLAQLRASAPADIDQVVSWLREAGCQSPVVVETGDAVTAAHCPAHPLTPPESLAAVVEFVHVARTPSDVNLGSQHVGDQVPTVRTPPPPSLPHANLGTPARQRDFYALPQSQRSQNATNLQMVWGCGTFGVNKTELGMFYDQYCADCNLDDVTCVACVVAVVYLCMRLGESPTH